MMKFMRMATTKAMKKLSSVLTAAVWSEQKLERLELERPKNSF